MGGEVGEDRPRAGARCPPGPNVVQDYFEPGFFAAAFLSGALVFAAAAAALPFAGAALFFALPPAVAVPTAAGTPPSLTSCRVSRAVPRAALLRCRMALDSARFSSR